MRMTPMRRPGLSMRYAYNPKTLNERNAITAKHTCIACGKRGGYISGDSGPQRRKENLVYYRAGLICQCHYLNFVNVIVNDLPGENTQTELTSEKALNEGIENQTLADWRVEELIHLSAAAAHNNKIEQACDIIDACITLDASSQAAWYNRGWLYANQNELELAINAYKKTLSLGNEFPSALLNLGYIYQELQEFTEAAHYFEKFLEKYPQHTDAKNRLAQCLS
ncbi:MAG: tetratricopeptide repeat protein [Pseudomonadota bacterium]